MRGDISKREKKEEERVVIKDEYLIKNIKKV
jgi:hypothetical protein